jgi:Tfp pilus assembly protein FimT
MKLGRKNSAETIQLEDGFFWSDENWAAIQQSQEYAINGALIIQEGRKQAGRPITLQPANKTKGWIKLRDLNKLREWQNLQEQFTLQFQWPHDQRSFNVIFNHKDGALESSTIKGTPATSLDTYFNVTMRFTEVSDGD